MSLETDEPTHPEARQRAREHAAARKNRRLDAATAPPTIPAMHDPASRDMTIPEVLAASDALIGQTIAVTGTLRTRGTTYFTDLQLVLEDDAGAALPVAPWRPLHVSQPPPGAVVGPRPTVIADFLDKRLRLVGAWQEHAGGRWLAPTRADVLTRRRPHRLTKAELAAVAGIGGVGLGGWGTLVGTLADGDGEVRLVTAAAGSRSEVSFALSLMTARADLLLGETVAIAGLIHKATPYTGTIDHARLVHAGSHLLPGMYVRVRGRIDERALMGIGGEAPPSGSYLILDDPLGVAGKPIHELFLEGRRFTDGAIVSVHGRLDARTFGGVETPRRTYYALSGVSDLGAREPIFDGAHFHALPDRTPLTVLTLRRAGLFDGPDTIVVLDPRQERAFLGTMGGLLSPGHNPFHGFVADAAITPATEEDRRALRFDDEGRAFDVESGDEALKVGELAPPPNTADGLTTTWFFDPAVDVIYQVADGGFAGLRHAIQATIHFPHEPATPSPGEGDEAAEEAEAIELGIG